MRMNVAVFNSGTAAATAHIEVVSVRCGQTLENRDLPLAPNTLTQISIPRQVDETCTPLSDFVDAATYYVTVVVDQPSLSYVTVLSNTRTPTAPLTVGIPH